MNQFSYHCFDNKDDGVIRFVPEIDVKETTITKEIYEKLFPKMDKQIDYHLLKLSNIGLYSITRPLVAEKICRIIKKLMKTTNITVTDAMGNMGGMTITFAKYFDHVNSCEIIPKHCEILKNNLEVYGLGNKVSIHCTDYLDVMKDLQQEIIFFDPPWGGREYRKYRYLSMYIDNVNIICIINNLLSGAKYILLKVPYNYNYNDLSSINQPMHILKLDKGNVRSEILIVIKGKMAVF